MPQNWQRLADFLREEISGRGWTQRDLAETAGVSPRAVEELLSGRRRRWFPPSLPKVLHAVGWNIEAARKIVFDDATPPDYGPAPQTQTHRFADPRLQKLWELTTFPESERMTMIAALVGRWQVNGAPYDPRGLHGEDWHDDDPRDHAAG